MPRDRESRRREVSSSDDDSDSRSTTRSSNRGKTKAQRKEDARSEHSRRDDTEDEDKPTRRRAKAKKPEKADTEDEDKLTRRKVKAQQPENVRSQRSKRDTSTGNEEGPSAARRKPKPQQQDGARPQRSRRDATADGGEAPALEADDDLAKAMQLSKSEGKKPSKQPATEADDDLTKALQLSKAEAKKPAPRQQENFDEDQLRQAVELSNQASHAPAREANGDFEDELRRALEVSEQAHRDLQVVPENDEELKQIIAESMRAHKEHQKHSAQCTDDAATLEEIIKQSEKAAKEDEVRRKERRKQQKVVFKAEIKQAASESVQEWKDKAAQRAKFLLRENHRREEIAMEEAKARKEAKRQARLNASRRYQEDDDEEMQAIIRQVQAQSLGDAPVGGGDNDTPEVDLPPYRNKRTKGVEKKVDPMEYTTTSRSPKSPGKGTRVTEAIMEEMRDRIVEIAQMRHMATQDPQDPFPPYFKSVKDDPRSKEGKAAGKKAKTPSKNGNRPAWDMATAVHGGTRQQVRTAVEATSAAGVLPVRVQPTERRIMQDVGSPWLAIWAPVQDRINRTDRR